MSEDLNRQGQRVGRKGGATRARLLEAARELLDSGVLPLSPVGIAKAARLSPATYYVYFDDVREMELALSEQARDDLREVAPLLDLDWRAPDAKVKALAFIAAYTRCWDEHRQVLLLRNFRADAGDHDFLAVRNATGLPFIRMIARSVRRGEADEQMAYARAIVFFASLDRLAAAAHLLPEPERTITPERLYAAQADILVMLCRP